MLLRPQLPLLLGCWSGHLEAGIPCPSEAVQLKVVLGNLLGVRRVEEVETPDFVLP